MFKTSTVPPPVGPIRSGVAAAPPSPPWPPWTAQGPQYNRRVWVGVFFLAFPNPTIRPVAARFGGITKRKETVIICNHSNHSSNVLSSSENGNTTEDYIPYHSRRADVIEPPCSRTVEPPSNRSGNSMGSPCRQSHRYGSAAIPPSFRSSSISLSLSRSLSLSLSRSLSTPLSLSFSLSLCLSLYLTNLQVGINISVSWQGVSARHVDPGTDYWTSRLLCWILSSWVGYP